MSRISIRLLYCVRRTDSVAPECAFLRSLGIVALDALDGSGNGWYFCGCGIVGGGELLIGSCCLLSPHLIGRIV